MRLALNEVCCRWFESDFFKLSTGETIHKRDRTSDGRLGGGYTRAINYYCDRNAGGVTWDSRPPTVSAYLSVSDIDLARYVHSHYRSLLLADGDYSAEVQPTMHTYRSGNERPVTHRALAIPIYVERTHFTAVLDTETCDITFEMSLATHDILSIWIDLGDRWAVTITPLREWASPETYEFAIR